MYLMNGTRFAGNEMLTIETYVAPSRIHGLGLFAAQNIEMGTIVSFVMPAFDTFVSKKTFETFPEITQRYIKKYAFYLNEYESYYMPTGDERFINHKIKSNIVGSVAQNSLFRYVAIVDIPSGSELTIDYATIDEEHYKRVTNFVERRDAQLWPPKVKL